MNNRPRLIAGIATIAVALCLTITLAMAHLTFDPSTLRQPPRPMTAIEPMEEEWVDLLSEIPVKTPSDPSPAYNPTPQSNESKASEASGVDVRDSGDKGASLPDVVTEQPSDVKRPKKEEQPQVGPSQEELEEEARRKARQGIADAFSKSDSKNNTTATGTSEGDTGTPSGQASDVDGSGQGTVGGGWRMPKYAKVPSTVTGSIELEAVVNSSGEVTSVKLVGGKAPAAATTSLVESCIKEVKSKRFTRSDSNPPERAIAHITYTFL